MHPSTAYCSFFGLFKPKRTTNRTLILPVGGYQSGKSYFIKHHLKDMGLRLDDHGLSVQPLPEMIHLDRDRIFFDLKASGYSLKRTKQKTHDSLLSVLQDEQSLIVYMDSTNTTNEQRVFYCQQFHPQKIVVIQFVLGDTYWMMSEEEKVSLYRGMVEQARRWREENGIPLGEEWLDTDRMSGHFRSIWENIQYVDDQEIEAMERLMNLKESNDDRKVIVLKVNAFDFESRESLAFRVFASAVCNCNSFENRESCSSSGNS